MKPMYYPTVIKTLMMTVLFIMASLHPIFSQESDTSMANVEFTEIVPDTTLKTDTLTTVQAGTADTVKK
ncbi:hypothetical protein [Pedobacter panaciterrae]